MLNFKLISFVETCALADSRPMNFSCYCKYDRNTQSKLFQPLNVIPKNAEIKTEDQLSIGHRLMVDQGFIRHAGVGSFHLLPLGIRALKKLSNIVDREMRCVGAQKIKLPFLTSGDLWKKTGRWDAAGSELYKLQDRHNKDFVLGPTHEEAITELVASISQLSYRNLPLLLYQMASKFRDEVKPRLGLLRSREFVMKDLYTFDATLDNARLTYEAISGAYDKIFSAVGVRYVRVEGEIGLMGGSMSHEYHYLADVGEDEVVLCKNCQYGANVQVCSDNQRCPKCSHDGMSKHTGIEVGHTFLLGTRYSQTLGAYYFAADGKPSVLQMGCYGIGLTRVLAAAAECLSLQDELRWPLSIAPFSICILPPKEGSKESVALELSDRIYDALNSMKGLADDVIIDDRCKLTIGRRLLDAKKTGYPFLVIIGKKAVLEEPLFEVHDVLQSQVQELTFADTVQYFSGKTSGIATL